MLQEAVLPTAAGDDLVDDPFTGRWCRLRPLVDDDFPLLYRAEVGSSWRLRGRVPEPQQYLEILNRNILTQMVVTPPDSDEPLGLVAAYGADLQGGHCRLLMVALPGSEAGAVRVMEGVTLLVRHLFANWPIRKIYFDTDQPGVEAMMARIPGDYLVEEARLVGHTYRDGDYVDQVTYALYREQWATIHDWFDAKEVVR